LTDKPQADFEPPLQQWSGRIRKVTIGAAPGGGRPKSTVTIGGATSLPFLDFEGEFPCRPLVAWEVPDSPPDDWLDSLKSAYGDCFNDPVAWAARAEKEGARLLSLTLQSTHPDRMKGGIEKSVEMLKKVRGATGLPMILKGAGPPEHQAEILSKVAEALEGENCLLASATEKNYKTVVAAAMAFGHSLVAETPIDVNLAKQLNILITDMNFPPERIVMDPLTGGLGYGLEYTYSVMERIRLQALGGDPMMQMPFICFVGEEAWRVKEVRVTERERPDWGGREKRAILWEIATALPLLQSGADILVMRHPEAIRAIEDAIAGLRGGGQG
jgi:acetyl-CoA decarbonylase/synthase complex subunit delta